MNTQNLRPLRVELGGELLVVRAAPIRRSDLFPTCVPTERWMSCFAYKFSALRNAAANGKDLDEFFKTKSVEMAQLNESQDTVMKMTDKECNLGFDEKLEEHKEAMIWLANQGIMFYALAGTYVSASSLAARKASDLASALAEGSPKGAGRVPSTFPLPGSYINKRYTIDMAGAPAGSATNAAGFARNGPWFWRQMLLRHPELFSEANAAAIRAGRSPVVDAKWVAGNATHQSFLGERLIHHHIEQGGIATALPECIHQAWSNMLHPN